MTYQSLGNQAVPFAYTFDAARGTETPDFTEMILERQADGTYEQRHFSYQALGVGRSDFDGPVPSFKSDSVRITFYSAQRWTDVSAGMTRMQQAAYGWAGARPIVFNQAGYWYDTQYSDIPADDHAPDLAAFLAIHQAACLAGGVSGRHSNLGGTHRSAER